VVAGKGRTSSVAEESVVLVPVAVIAAIPHQAGPLPEETVRSVEAGSGA
jgi:hypothetical protein